MRESKKLWVVGIGPGAREQMTLQALNALEGSDLIVGYTVYVELIRDRFPGKRFLSTPMLKEVDRCRMALEEAKRGLLVSMVCGGDSGVYGMAGLVLELSAGYPEVEVEIVPGVTAALGGGAALGAPLCHDFAVISLSDRLTPWELIEKRLIGAAEGDMAICIYNPSSKGRADHLKRACEVLLKRLGPETVCGLVRNIGREGESVRILCLRELKDARSDMFTTVFIGNSTTRAERGWMVTPRGYLHD